MSAERAVELIKELQRKPDTLPPYNMDGVRQVYDEIRTMAELNARDVQVIQAGGAAEQASRYGQVVVRHACIERNKRCAVAYHHERWRRVRQLRWQHGSVLPAEVRTAMSAHEMTMFQGCVRKFTNTNKYQFRYNTALATYMRSLGGGIGLDITLDQQPPTAQLNNYGELQTCDGHILNLCENTTHSLRRVDAEPLIRQRVMHEL